MIEKDITVVNRSGVHTRPAAMIVKLAAQYKSEIFLTGDNQLRINAKSIIGVMTLAAAQGTVLHLTVLGDDEQLATDKLTELFSSGFGEHL